MFNNIPFEITHSIFLNLDDRLDFKSLSEVSKPFNRLATPYLYRSILITTARKINGILLAHQRAGVLCYTKDIRVRREADEQWINRRRMCTGSDECLHWKWNKCCYNINQSNGAESPDIGEVAEYESTTSAEIEDKERWIDPEGEAAFYIIPGFSTFKRQILSILIRCKEGMLRSFSWERADCIPLEILGEGGYLPEKQKTLEALFLRAGGHCGFPDRNPQLFRKLKRLAWDNLGTDLGGVSRSYDEDVLRKLRSCLEINCRQLEHLELKLTGWEYILHQSNHWDANISQKIIMPLPNDTRFYFQNLQHLCLTGFNFENNGIDIVDDLNPAALHTLSIRACKEWSAFLDRLNMCEVPFRLHTVEVQAWSESDTGSFENQDIARFIYECELLVNLYVAIRDWEGTLELWSALSRHLSTLKAFVYYIDPTTKTFENFTPFSIPGVSFEDPHCHKNRVEWNPLKDLKLEFLGINYEFKYLIPVLTPVTKNSCLKVLLIRSDPLYVIDYLRAAEKDAAEDFNTVHDELELDYCQSFDTFIQWAFGSDGFPSLQMIGLGDFADSVDLGDRALLCPKSDADLENTFPGKNYRFVSRRDHVQQELLREYAGAMQACPTYLIEEWQL